MKSKTSLSALQAHNFEQFWAILRGRFPHELFLLASPILNGVSSYPWLFAMRLNAKKKKTISAVASSVHEHPKNVFFLPIFSES